MERIQNVSYSPTDILGEGRYSTVLKGTLHNSNGHGDVTVAVKRFSKNTLTETKFNSSCDLVYKAKNPNIIDFYCTLGNKDFKYAFFFYLFTVILLVYEVNIYILV